MDGKDSLVLLHTGKQDVVVFFIKNKQNQTDQTHRASFNLQFLLVPQAEDQVPYVPCTDSHLPLRKWPEKLTQ